MMGGLALCYCLAPYLTSVVVGEAYWIVGTDVVAGLSELGV